MNPELVLAEFNHRFERLAEYMPKALNAYEDLQEQLRLERNNRKISKKELAKILGISERTVQRWDTGASTVKEYCEYFKTKELYERKYLPKLKQNYKG